MAIKKKPPEAEKENGERWLVSYADFITLLLAFFIMMYATASADAQAAGSNGAGQAQALAALAQAFGGGKTIIGNYDGSSIIDGHTGKEKLSNGAIEAMALEEIEKELEEYGEMSGLGDSLDVVIDDFGMHIRIKDAVLFSSGSFYINNEAKPVMYKIGEALKKLPNNKIQVDGHTDNIPINNGLIASNWELGSLRAVNVAKILIEECALNPKNISATSYGEFQPIASNLTVDGRAQNRRVEITLLRNYDITEI
ncbi:MAG: OmpA family protein [Clostridia bacterium]|nr:OmpA family protein [Clostridia bacterium]